jgi:Na+-transporting methylmalonyl-CoA/oxaloacetate decarboxylase gamma subunit
MGIEVVLVVLAVVVLLIGGTVFSAWRAERAAENDAADAAEDEPLP